MNKQNNLQLGKETWEHLENIHRFGYSSSTIFSDFLDTCLSSLLSLTDNLQHPDVFEKLKNNKLTGKYEAQYMSLVEKYKENKTREKGSRPADYFANAWGSLLKETWESQEDILGEIFMNKISFGEHGQFFTPFNLADMMTKLLHSPEEMKPGEKVCDPACGSGRFLICYGKLNKAAHLYGVDLSPECAKMSALNMWLFDLDADIYHGDSLAMKYFHVWKIRKGGYIYESEITEESPIPHSIKKTFKAQAEQQRLFDLENVTKQESEVR
jgi:type I restriction-modification system DNA methylase subunit